MKKLGKLILAAAAVGTVTVGICYIAKKLEKIGDMAHEEDEDLFEEEFIDEDLFVTEPVQTEESIKTQSEQKASNKEEINEIEK